MLFGWEEHVKLGAARIDLCSARHLARFNIDVLLVPPVFRHSLAVAHFCARSLSSGLVNMFRGNSQQIGRAATRSWRPARQVGQRRYASESGEKSFKGQLYDSTAQRLQRERADQARFAELRAAQKSSGGTPAWVVPFGM